MWRLFNKLFGWHYVEYKDSLTTFVARVMETPNNKLRMVTVYGIYDCFLEKEGKTSTGRSWEPITWDGSLPESKGFEDE